MKNLIISFLFFAIFVFLPSCSQQELSHENTDVTTMEVQSRDQYMELSPEDRKQVWIARMQSYQSLDLSNTQKDFIAKMVVDLKSMESGSFYISDELKKHAISMAKITPEADFINLFTDVSQFINLSKSGNICVSCLSDLENYVKPQSNIGQTDEKKLDCNCRWTCAQMDIMGMCVSTDDCKVTNDGCGFLELYECTGGCY